MDEKDFTLPEMSNSEGWLFLYILCSCIEEEANTLIRDFEAELIYHNRFSSNHKVINELHVCASRATKEVKAGSAFYRARVFHENIVDKLLKEYLNESGAPKEESIDVLKNWSDYQKTQLLALWEACDTEENYPHIFKNKQVLKLVAKKWRKNVRFKGYNAKASTAPTADKIGDGRANPDHIRYLYLCEDEFTPVYEVRAGIGDQVSIAKFKLQKDIRLYDLAAEFDPKSVDGTVPCLFKAIGSLFSRPYKEKRENYIATQFLTEEIKRMGFDGLRFESSLHRGGYNVVLFDPEICKPVSSDVAFIHDIEIKMQPHWVYFMDKT